MNFAAIRRFWGFLEFRPDFHRHVAGVLANYSPSRQGRAIDEIACSILPSEMSEAFPILISVAADDAGKRLDQFLVAHLEVSRARVQQLISEEKVLVNDAPPKASLKLRGGERIRVLGSAARPPLRAIAEDIKLDIIYEDDDLAVINKAAGMMVHAGAGATEDKRNRGTLVNALLHHFASLSAVGGEMRPGIVHRLDKETSGLIVVAKNDEAHRKLAAQFARREVKKTYIALVHGWVKKDRGTITASISRDRVRRVRMTTRGTGGRDAVSHYVVLQRLDTAFGKFTLVEVKIDTGRTHQIRVHMASLGHAVVGDALYGAPREVGLARGREKDSEAISLPRNFLHAAKLELEHPRTGKKIALQSPLPVELQAFLTAVERDVASHVSTKDG
jgi:23S rRNA pseudouridine1911/1915/1917 synthase